MTWAELHERMAHADAVLRAPPRPMTAPPRDVDTRAALVAAWRSVSGPAIRRGLTNAEIAAELYISASTAKFHVASLMTKLGARHRVELAIWAYKTGRVR